MTQNSLFKNKLQASKCARVHKLCWHHVVECPAVLILLAFTLAVATKMQWFPIQIHNCLHAETVLTQIFWRKQSDDHILLLRKHNNMKIDNAYGIILIYLMRWAYKPNNSVGRIITIWLYSAFVISLVTEQWIGTIMSMASFDCDYVWKNYHHMHQETGLHIMWLV